VPFTFYFDNGSVASGGIATEIGGGVYFWVWNAPAANQTYLVVANNSNSGNVSAVVTVSSVDLQNGGKIDAMQSLLSAVNENIAWLVREVRKGLYVYLKWFLL